MRHVIRGIAAVAALLAGDWAAADGHSLLDVVITAPIPAGSAYWAGGAQEAEPMAGALRRVEIPVADGRIVLEEWPDPPMARLRLPAGEPVQVDAGLIAALGSSDGGPDLLDVARSEIEEIDLVVLQRAGESLACGRWKRVAVCGTASAGPGVAVPPAADEAVRHALNGIALLAVGSSPALVAEVNARRGADETAWPTPVWIPTATPTRTPMPTPTPTLTPTPGPGPNQSSLSVSEPELECGGPNEPRECYWLWLCHHGDSMACTPTPRPEPPAWPPTPTAAPPSALDVVTAAPIPSGGGYWLGGAFDLVPSSGALRRMAILVEDGLIDFEEWPDAALARLRLPDGEPVTLDPAALSAMDARETGLSLIGIAAPELVGTVLAVSQEKSGLVCGQWTSVVVCGWSSSGEDGSWLREEAIRQAVNGLALLAVGSSPDLVDAANQHPGAGAAWWPTPARITTDILPPGAPELPTATPEAGS